MCNAHIVLFSILTLLSACGCAKRDRERTTFTMATESLPEKYGGKNPIALLMMEGIKARGFCTASIVDRQYVVTAGHCIIHESETLAATQLRIFFQNPGDKEPQEFSIASIVQAEFRKKGGADWAVLSISNHQEMVERYGSLSASKSPRKIENPLDFLWRAEGEMLGYDPVNGVNQFRLVQKRAKFEGTIPDLTFDSLDLVAVPGNSGSPILVKDVLIGILSTSGVGGSTVTDFEHAKKANPFN